MFRREKSWNKDKMVREQNWINSFLKQRKNLFAS